MKRHIAALWPVMLFLLLPAIVFHWKILFGGGILCGGDMINQFVPWREFALDEIRRGRFPGWNPYVFCGTPFAANIQTSLFYPFNLLNLFFSVERTFTLSLVVHHLLSLVSMYCFLNSLWKDKSGAVAGALVYGWSGFFITHGHDGHLIHIRAYALVPLVLYLQTRWLDSLRFSRIFIFALGLAGLFYAGHTQLPLYVFYLLLARACWWGGWEYYRNRRFTDLIKFPLWTMFGLILAILIGAKVLFPLYELSTLTAGRAGGMDYQFATNDSMPPQHLITLIAPFFYGDPVSSTREGQFWETRTGYHEICGYIGILPLILLFFIFIPDRSDPVDKKGTLSRFEAFFFLAIALLALFFSLGQFNPLYPILYHGLPGWAYFRVPGRLVFLFILGLSVCSARGYKLWQQVSLKEISTAWYCKIPLILSVLFGIGTLILVMSKTGILALLRELEIDRTLAEYGLDATSRLAIGLRLPDILFETRYSAMLGACLTACGIGLLCWGSLILSVRYQRSQVWRWVPIGVFLFDLLLFGHRFIETKPADEWRETYFPQTELVTFLQENARGYRVLCLDDAIGYPALEKHPELRPNRLMHYRIESARGYDPIILKSYTRFVNRIYGKEPDTPQGGLLFFPESPPSDYLDMMNVKYIITAQTLPEPYKIAWQKDNTSVKAYEYPSAKPRAYLQNVSPGDNVSILSSVPGCLEILADTTAEKRVIVSQGVHPRWFIGPVSCPELSLDEFPISFTVKPGKSTIPIVFSPFQPLFYLTEITLILGIIVICLERRMGWNFN